MNWSDKQELRKTLRLVSTLDKNCSESQRSLFQQTTNKLSNGVELAPEEISQLQNEFEKLGYKGREK